MRLHREEHTRHGCCPRQDQEDDHQHHRKHHLIADMPPSHAARAQLSASFLLQPTNHCRADSGMRQINRHSSSAIATSRIRTNPASGSSSVTAKLATTSTTAAPLFHPALHRPPPASHFSMTGPKYGLPVSQMNPLNCARKAPGEQQKRGWLAAWQYYAQRCQPQR